MNEMQKIQIAKMRANGMGYGRIAITLGISANTVKSFCRRNKLCDASKAAAFKTEPQKKHLCPSCGEPVAQNDKRKEKKFCSDKCRMTWWNSNRDKVNLTNATDYECAYCHKHFKSYSRRKYCCHKCYIEDRFGGTVND